jgi:hypothetical protein
MNNKERQKIINDNLRLLDPYSRHGSYVNQIRINIGNSYEHERLKFDECFRLKKKGYDFFTEAEFPNGGRADIVDLVNGEIIEILHSETIEEAMDKTKKYPSDLFVRFIHTHDALKKVME